MGDRHSARLMQYYNHENANDTKTHEENP